MEISSKMDVVPDRELYDFIESLGVKEKKVENGDETRGKGGYCEEKRKEKDVCHDIADAVNDWSRCIIDAEYLHNRSEDLMYKHHEKVLLGYGIY